MGLDLRREARAKNIIDVMEYYAGIKKCHFQTIKKGDNSTFQKRA